MKAKNLVLVLVLAALAAGAAYWARQHFSAGSEQGQQAQHGPGGGYAVGVSVVTIQPQDVVFTKDLPGRASAFRVAEIRPQVSGIILKRLFDEGSDVEEGQQLYQIDPAPYQAAYESAQADLLKAQANIKSIQAKDARYTELVKIGGISQQEFDDVRANLAQSKADVAIAQARLATAKINLDYTRVLSPISGRIGQSSVTEGALVTANQPASLAVIQQIDKVYVDVTQSSDELIRLRRHYNESRQGENGEESVRPSARLLAEGEVFGAEGELQFSDVSVNPSTGTVLLRILFDNPHKEILPGLFVHARLVQFHDKAALLVSQKALIRNADGSTMVWVVGADNKVEPRPVIVADTYGDQWRVVEGLQAGDRVIVEGVQKIGPGMVVNPVDVPAEVSAVGQEAVEIAPGLSTLSEMPPVDNAEIIETPPASNVLKDDVLSGTSAEPQGEQDGDGDHVAPVILDSAP